MSVQILTDSKSGESCMFCNTSDWAFGPVFDRDEDPFEFMEWLAIDPRELSDSDLEKRVWGWRLLKQKETKP